MKLLTSKKFELPILYFIEDREEIKDVPIGVPFVYGSRKDEARVVRMLEYEVIWKKAIESGFPFKFEKLLREAGFNKVKFHDFCESTYIDHKNSGDYDIDKIESTGTKLYEGESSAMFEDFIEDCSAVVNVDMLKDLKVFPVWLTDIEEAIATNVHNFAVYNPYMYNKKLDGMYGGIDTSSPNKNLIVIDISGSIPRAVGTTCLTLAKHLVETFYADLMITGSKTFLFQYEEMQELEVDTLYDSIGLGNESVMYRELVTGEPKKYSTAIVFGDDHSPCDHWWGQDAVGRDDAKKQCTWTVEKMISLHTTSNNTRAGYGDYFDVKEVSMISDWVSYIKK